MKRVVMLKSKDLFPDEYLELKILVQDIPSIVVLAVLASINSRFFIDDPKPELQVRILNEVFLFRQPLEISQKIRDNVVNFFRNRPDIDFENHALFSAKTVLMFMEYELTNYREKSDGWQDTNSEDELKLFKALLLFNDQLDSKLPPVSKIGKIYSPDTFFYEVHWPLIVLQYDFMKPIDPIYQMIKGVVLMSELKKAELSFYVNKFLEINKRVSIHEYLLEIMQLIIYCTTGNNQSLFSRSGFTLEGDNIPTFYDSNCINPEDYHRDEKYKINHNGLKSKPLIKLEESQYLVFHWNFLAKKLYDGLIFDFLNVTGVEEERGLTYPNFKSKYSDKIVEKIIFKNVMTYLLCGKKNLLHFEESQGEPDLYYRNKNNVILFEFKDVSFASSTIDSSTYEAIRDEIEKKICLYSDKKGEKSKGVGQMIKFIEKIVNSQYNFDSFENMSKWTIHPVIVITDEMFEIPGINRYINTIFTNHIEQYRGKFQKIEDVIIVNFDFLFSYIGKIKKGEYKLLELIAGYNKYIKYRQKQFKTVHQRPETWDEIHISFSHYISKKLDLKKDKDLIKIMFEIFDLKYGLPIGSDS
ncbi:MAG: hypothetical protein V4620_03845 [Bacteroidota bacterium]